MIAAEARRAGLRVMVWREAELRRRKFGALLAVAAGSRNRPALVILEHKPRGARGTVALVGKGVTFDSGGINLKTGPTIAEMKADMAGGAAVAATLAAAARLGLKRHVVGLIPLVENMPSGSATRPGDIVRTYAGRTVEIGNTDAEGRLILADAIAHAIRAFNPEVLIDVATLTGACVVALGEKIAGLFANDLPLQEAIVAAGRRTHERCWPMPLPEDYKDLLKSDVADLSNMPPSRYGGAIAAALFLAEFVGTTRWAHIDIAGPAFNKKEDGYTTPGATGFGVRLLLDWLADHGDAGSMTVDEKKGKACTRSRRTTAIGGGTVSSRSSWDPTQPVRHRLGHPQLPVPGAAGGRDRRGDPRAPGGGARARHGRHHPRHPEGACAFRMARVVPPVPGPSSTTRRARVTPAVATRGSGTGRGGDRADAGRVA